MGTTATPIPPAKPAAKPRALLSADVTDEWLRSATPEQRSITYEDGYRAKGHQAEINMADWLYSKFGGNIILLKESKEPGDRTPDYLWNRRFWELKRATTDNSVDRAIREAAKQIQENPGGIILDVSESELSLEVIENLISQRMRRVALDFAEVFVVAKGELKKVLRYIR